MRPVQDNILSKPLWIDAPDAATRVVHANISPHIRTAALELIEDGFTILRGAQDPNLCDQVIADYERYVSENAAYVDACRDSLGREQRLVNFHLYSDAESQLATNPHIMELLDFLFGAEACVYTSLTFKYGTQQPAHRDTPHFATWPDGYFCGAWTALEDIAPEAGPLFYYAGAHRYPIDVAGIWREAAMLSDLTPEQQLNQALEIYNGQVLEQSPRHGDLRVADMKKGDVAIWHPQTPHGGAPASDPLRSRWSVVFHCAPKDKQVHQHGSYFRHAGREEPPPRYGFTEAHGRKIALAGTVGFQV